MGKLFNTISNQISYEDIIQLDGAFATQHALYENRPSFNGIDAKSIANDLEPEGDNQKRLELWKHFWLEYIDAFDALIASRPDSVATAYLGGHAVELGLKYLLLAKTNAIVKTHDLGTLAEAVESEYEPKQRYFEWLVDFCKLYQQHVEGNRIEYFRYPEYGKSLPGNLFQGMELDVRWISYNLALIILKLLHLAELEQEFE